MKRLIAIALMVFSATAFATNGGEPNNTNCNGVGNPNSPCVGNGGNGGNGGAGGHGGSGGAGGSGVGVGIGVAGAAANSQSNSSASSSSRVDSRNTNLNVNRNTARGGAATSSATGGSATASGGTAYGGGGGSGYGGAGGSAQSRGGDQQQSATATGGAQSQRATATGGNQSQQSSATGGSADNAGNNQSITIQGSEAAPAEITVKNTPDAPAIIASPTAPCRVQGGVGASAPGFGLSFGGSVLDEGCHRRETSRHLHNMGLRDAAVQVMCLDETAKAALEATGTKCIVKQEEPAGATASNPGA